MLVSEKFLRPELAFEDVNQSVRAERCRTKRSLALDVQICSLMPDMLRLLVVDEKIV